MKKGRWQALSECGFTSCQFRPGAQPARSLLAMSFIGAR